VEIFCFGSQAGKRLFDIRVLLVKQAEDKGQTTLGNLSNGAETLVKFVLRVGSTMFNTQIEE
jgi:hypothetical protein